MPQTILNIRMLKYKKAIGISIVFKTKIVLARREDSKRGEHRLNVGKAARDGYDSERRGADAGTHVMWVT